MRHPIALPVLLLALTACRGATPAPADSMAATPAGPARGDVFHVDPATEVHRIEAVRLLYDEGLIHAPGAREQLQQAVNRYYAGAMSRDSSFRLLLVWLEDFRTEHPGQTAYQQLQAQSRAARGAQYQPRLIDSSGAGRAAPNGPRGRP